MNVTTPILFATGLAIRALEKDGNPCYLVRFRTSEGTVNFLLPQCGGEIMRKQLEDALLASMASQYE